MIKFNIRNFNVFTLVSLLALIAGVSFYIYWGITFNVWYDIGPYAFSIVFILGGIIGILLTLYEKTEGQQE
ncbi:MAG: hypothetical protein QHH19_00865 [Candidatus Thermoplasmatota archaeon]|jgi:hypothetical protein|nr:hypothetical protein [Candidatus Thermoplasmatota archaeon]